jgi:hypothetical protein
MDNLVVIGLLVFWFALVVIPIARILRRTGFIQWLALIALLPLVNLIGLWTFAFSEWRTDTAPDPRQGDEWSSADNEAFKKALAEKNL